MPFDGSGTFNRNRSWASDAEAKIKIRSDYHDAHDGDLANGLSQCITKNGSTQPTADIPLNSKKLVNVGQPTSAQDAATKSYVDNFRDFATSINIAGAGLNGFINFTSPTGVNGIGWVTADMSWIGREYVPSQRLKALAINDAKDGTGTDVFSIDELGRLTSTGSSYAHNVLFDGGSWRTPAAGIASVFSWSNGSLNLYSTDVATAVAWQAAPIRNFATLNNNGGNVMLSLTKTDGNAKTVEIYSTAGGAPRWLIRPGNAATESGTRTGSDFQIYSFDNAGTAPVAEIDINRSTHLMTTGGAITSGGSITASSGQVISTGGYFQGSTTAAVLGVANGGTGTVYLRPNGITNGTGESRVTTAGDLAVARYVVSDGYQGKQGTGGALATSYNNFYYSSTPKLQAWVNTTYIGDVTLTCDYRVKKDVAPLPSTWDVVKALNPISYTHKEYVAEDGTLLVEESDTVHWGFLAHELQERLLPSAASSDKDAPHALQSPNLMAVIAGLTRALQEAMARIEALEAAA